MKTKLTDDEINRLCDTCRDTGFYGDNGPGIKSNNEYQICECRNGQPHRDADSKRKARARLVEGCHDELVAVLNAMVSSHSNSLVLEEQFKDAVQAEKRARAILAKCKEGE